MRMKRIEILLLCCMMSVAGFAQAGLHIANLFGERFRYRKDATEVVIGGDRLKPYKLNLFRSLTIKPSAAEVNEFEASVKADVVGALDREAGLRQGRLYYGFYRLRSAGTTNRFIFYRNNTLRAGASPTLTLIYMEGNATLAELKQRFAK